MEPMLETRVALLEERVKNVMLHFDGLSKYYVTIPDNNNLESRIAVLEKEVELISLKLESKIEKTEFWPVKSIVYGFAGIVLIGFVSALLVLLGIKYK